MAHLTDPELMQEAEETLLRSLIEFKANVYKRLDALEAAVAEIYNALSTTTDSR